MCEVGGGRVLWVGRGCGWAGLGWVGGGGGGWVGLKWNHVSDVFKNPVIFFTTNRFSILFRYTYEPDTALKALPYLTHDHLDILIVAGLVQYLHSHTAL